MFASRGDTASARDAFDEAIGLFRGMDAQWALRSASARLAGHGIRPGHPHRDRARPARGWESLTPTEAKIARLVADGLSNPEIAAALNVSAATVRTHVNHILAKFGARSRMEIVASAARGSSYPAGRPRREDTAPM
jgi:DNA-binding CsgD family transcriptional regulator